MRERVSEGGKNGLEVACTQHVDLGLDGNRDLGVCVDVRNKGVSKVLSIFPR